MKFFALLSLFFIVSTVVHASPTDTARIFFQKGDYATALTYAQPSAEQGDAAAQNMLGDMYLEGKGVKKDSEKAFKWYSKAANQGDASAAHSLGQMYEQGISVTPDAAEAKKWYSAANAHRAGQITVASEQEFVDFCKKSDCKKDTHINLKKMDGTTYDKTIPLLPPVVYLAHIAIYAGETVYVEADETSTGLTHFVHVDSITKPEKTLVFKLDQDPKLADGKAMLFTVHNPFSKEIVYNLRVMPLDRDGLTLTSVCPVGAGLKNYEMFPYPIFQVHVGQDIRFLKKGEPEGCKK